MSARRASRLSELRQLRSQLQREGRWMVVERRVCREWGCGRMIGDHAPPCRACGRAPEHHVHGDEEREWEGKAAMAAARRAAGVPLSIGDIEALDRYPEPRPRFERVAA